MCTLALCWLINFSKIDFKKCGKRGGEDRGGEAEEKVREEEEEVVEKE